MNRPPRNYFDDLFDEVQSRTYNYYHHKKHLYNTLDKQWPAEGDKEAIGQAILKAVQHVTGKLLAAIPDERQR